MALWDFLKRKKGIEKAKEKKTKKKEEKNPPKVLPLKKEEVESGKLGKKAKGFFYEIIKEPHISEKATNLSEKSKYVFKVYPNATKQEVKKSVEGIYGVDVLSVKMVNIPKKKRRIGRQEGFRKGYVKTIVTIKEGQKIEII